MKTLLLASVAALSVLSASAAHTAEIVVQPHVGAATIVSLRGVIEKGDHIQFNKLTQAIKGNVDVVLNSRGGEMWPAIQIGSFLHMNQWTTNVRDGSVCNSACSIIWLSGVHRFLGTQARIGLHSIATSTGGHSDFGNGIAFGYLRSIGVSEVIIQRMWKTDPNSLDFIYYTEARSLGLLNEPPDLPWWTIKPIPSAGKMPPLMKINP